MATFCALCLLAFRLLLNVEGSAQKRIGHSAGHN